MFRKFAIAAFAAALIFAPHVEACTGIRLIAVDGGVVPGRTLEFGFDLKSDVIVIPKGARIIGSTPNGSHGISYTTKYWILGNFATIDEVKAHFDKVVLVPVVVEAIKQAPPVHFVIHDRSGKSVVIEPVDNTLKIHDNPLGVMSNAPAFDWHMTNLRNYINL